MRIRRFDLRRDIGRTKRDIRQIVGAFAAGDPLWIMENDMVYDDRLKKCVGSVMRIRYPVES